MPTTDLQDSDFSDGKIGVIDLLVKGTLAASRGEARRLIDQGGVSVDSEKVSGIDFAISKDAFDKGYIILKKGKKVYHKFLLS